VLNRDASLLFYDAEIARYFEQVFIYDWENWAKAKVSVRKKKPAVQEVSDAKELAALRRDAATGDIRPRRLFHPDD
ncbi:MAG: hypothetical protein ACRED3_18540, partial [Bradyrhizobium sp.]